jgi:3'-phosphoadenosine 5'-phosphosulfate sulfotransferase
MQRYVQSARTNHAILLAYETVLANREPGEAVLLDYGLDGVFFMAAGSAFKSMELLLSASDVPYAVIEARQATVEEQLGTGKARLAVLNSDKVAPLGRSFTLTPLMPGGGRGGPGFGVYRVAPRR